MRFSIYLAATAVLVAIAASQTPQAAAQGGSFGTSRSTGSSAFGNRTLGGGVSGGQRSFSSGSAARSTTADQTGGQITGNERFLRENRQPGDFVGATSADATNPYSQAGAAQSAFGGGMGGRGGMMGANQFGALGGLGGMQNQRQNQQFNQFNQQNMGGAGGAGRNREVRAEMVLGFNPTIPAPSVVGNRLQTQLTKTRGLDRLGAIQVQVQGRTVVLQGVVRTEHDRVLAEQLAMLEPGVSDVQNELQLPPAGDEATIPLPAP